MKKEGIQTRNRKISTKLKKAQKDQRLDSNFRFLDRSLPWAGYGMTPGFHPGFPSMSHHGVPSLPPTSYASMSPASMSAAAGMALPPPPMAHGSAHAHQTAGPFGSTPPGISPFTGLPINPSNPTVSSMAFGWLADGQVNPEPNFTSWISLHSPKRQIRIHDFECKIPPKLYSPFSLGRLVTNNLYRYFTGNTLFAPFDTFRLQFLANNAFRQMHFRRDVFSAKNFCDVFDKNLLLFVTSKNCSTKIVIDFEFEFGENSEIFRVWLEPKLLSGTGSDQFQFRNTFARNHKFAKLIRKLYLE